MNKFSFLISFLLVIVAGNGNVSAQSNNDFSAVPPESQKADPPLVMLTMSRDHQYFFKAYNDYTDLDPENTSDVDINGNPNIETTYKHSFDYYGYFDARKCYSYSDTNGRFVPENLSDASNYCEGAGSGEWSGNFLNWLSMTRMDTVRSIFYGGKRSTDSATRTVLERAHLPMDAHSFAKYYNGDDIAKLTPYDPVHDAGGITSRDGYNDGFDDKGEGITFCNTTYNVNSGASQDSTSPPLIRAVEGNYQLWNSNERWQCLWEEDRTSSNQGNGNIPPSDPKEFEITREVNGVVETRTIEVDSGIDAHSNDPKRSDGKDYIARVEVCKSGLIGTERCKLYPSGNLKPVGLLQTYGDNDLIRFGLMTGSYKNNIQGGVLRKNIGAFADEVNTLTDGTFKFTNSSESIVRTLNNLRIWGYRYSDGTYRGGGTDFDNCSFQLNEIPSGRCNSWGNPISEVYKETIRYLANLSPDPKFAADDTTFIKDLSSHTWSNPLDDKNQCSDLSTILINASVSSYDDDETAIADIKGGINGSVTNADATTIDKWTDLVGDGEGLSDLLGGSAKQFFIGQNGTNNNEACTAKPIGQLSKVFGLCPEAPTVAGSFAMAGMAYYAHNNDLRDDLGGNQTLNTYAISLATNVPIIKIPRTSGPAIEILPAYRNLKFSDDPGGGALVDFRIVQPHTKVVGALDGRATFKGSFYVSWEDSEQGGDYDQDMWGKIDYILDEAANELTVTTTAVEESTSTAQLFGFVTNGTTEDGFHAFSGINGADYTSNYANIPGCDNCRALGEGNDGQKGPESYTFTLAKTQTISTIESPLYYAAKYGGFDESLDENEVAAIDDLPDEIDEWDSVNNTTGADGSDGLPDNFFFVINPENLFDSLERSLNKILSEERAASSAVASFANSNGFGNIIIQGTYQELLRDPALAEVEWTGEIFTYFIDDFGLFREDNQSAGTQGLLDKYEVDRPFRYDVSADEPRIQFLSISRDVDGKVILNASGTPELTKAGEPEDLAKLTPLWSGGERLRSINNEKTKQQRVYSDRFPDPGADSASRYIFTYIDSDLDGKVDTGEQIDFTTDAIDADNFGYFGVLVEDSADNIVNYIRGFDDTVATDFRNRTVNLTGVAGGDEVYRLGDLVNSTPLVVASPSSGYDVRFDDESYALFKEKYDDRRQVAYIGANDGLLHAFNAGFRDTNSSEVEYKTLQTGKTEHPLGAELWAYAPYNLLPHLQWLTSNSYNHVFYIDGSPKTFDVKLPSVFSDTDIYPGNWGTILVVGMRLGGGDFPITNGTDSTTLRSAYIVLDITDPERPPRVLAEITDPDLNFTTSSPDLFYSCGSFCEDSDDDNNFDGDWKLIFGSGPNDIDTFTSNETAKVFAYDFKTQSLEVEVVGDQIGDVVDSSFVGNVSVRDWDNGLLGFRNDDAAYFGTVGSTLDLSTTSDLTDRVETGAVFRYRPQIPSGRDSVSLLIDVDRPVAQAPLLTNRGEIGSNVQANWVYFATGIYLNKDNELIDEQERLYGVIEPLDKTTLAALSTADFDADRENSDLLEFDSVVTNQLVDVSSVEVLNNDDGSLGVNVSTGDFKNPLAAAGGAKNVGALAEYILNNSQGWYKNLPIGVTAGDPSTRVIDEITPTRDQLFFTAFTPDSDNRLDICIGGEGISELFVVNQSTGVPSSFATLGVDNTGVINDSLVIGAGAASSPLVFTSEALGSNDGTIVIQREDGSLTPSLDDDPGLSDRPIGDSRVIRSGWREILQ